MTRITLFPDAETLERLSAAATAERRRLDQQADVILRRSLGLPVPCLPTPDLTAPPAPSQKRARKGALVRQAVVS